MNNKTLNTCANIFLIIMVLGFVGGMGFLHYPFKIIELVQPYRVLNENKEVFRGDRLIYEVEYTKFYDTPATIYRNIICDDDNLVTLAPQKSNVPAGSHKIVRNDVVIPEKTSRSNCYLEVVLDYDWHKLRNIRYTFRTESFKVI